MRNYYRKLTVFFLLMLSCFAGSDRSEAGPKQKLIAVNGQVRPADKITLPNGVPAFVGPVTPAQNQAPQAPMVEVSPPMNVTIGGTRQQVRQLNLSNGESYTITDQVPQNATAYGKLSLDEEKEFLTHRLAILKGLVIALNITKWISGATVATADALSGFYNMNVPPKSFYNLDGPAAEPPSSAIQRGIQQTLSFLDSMLWSHADIVADEHEYYNAILKGKGAGILVGKYGGFAQGCWGLYLAYNPTRKEFRFAIITDLARGRKGGVAEATTLYQVFVGIRARQPGDEGVLNFHQFNLPGPLIGTSSAQDFSIGLAQGFGTLPPMLIDKVPFNISDATKSLLEDFPLDNFYTYDLTGSRVTLVGFSFSPAAGVDIHTNFFDFIGQLFAVAKTYMVEKSVPFAQRQVSKACHLFFD